MSVDFITMTRTAVNFEASGAVPLAKTLSPTETSPTVAGVAALRSFAPGGTWTTFASGATVTTTTAPAAVLIVTALPSTAVTVPAWRDMAGACAYNAIGAERDRATSAAPCLKRMSSMLNPFIRCAGV
jgi:hypothetical protein